MTRILATDQNNDIYVGADGHLAVKTGIDAVMQACEHACLAQLGEMVYAVDRGMPTMAALWSGQPKIGLYEAAIRSQLLAVKDVVRVLDLSVGVSGDAFFYHAKIETIYGTGELNG